MIINCYSTLSFLVAGGGFCFYRSSAFLPPGGWHSRAEGPHGRVARGLWQGFGRGPAYEQRQSEQRQSEHTTSQGGVPAAERVGSPCGLPHLPILSLYCHHCISLCNRNQYPGEAGNSSQFYRDTDSDSEISLLGVHPQDTPAKIQKLSQLHRLPTAALLVVAED